MVAQRSSGGRRPGWLMGCGFKGVAGWCMQMLDVVLLGGNPLDKS